MFHKFVSLCHGGEIWSRGADGSALGLDYQQLRSLLDLLRIELSQEEVESFRIMARAVIEVKR